MKKTAMAAAVIVLLTLTGCGMTLDELADLREKCEALDGTYEQWDSGVGEDARCDLEREPSDAGDES